MGFDLAELEVGVEEEDADEDAVPVELDGVVAGVGVVVLDALEVLAAAELCEALARKQP